MAFNSTIPKLYKTLQRPLLLSQCLRHESIQAKDITTRSPYEELRVDIEHSSSKDKPMKVNAYGDERTIACVCDDMRFMTLKKGPPVKCRCGYWFQLVDAKKFWDEAERGP